MDEASLLFAMLRNQLNGQALDIAALSAEQLSAVRALAAHHRLSHLVAAGVIAGGLTDDPRLLAECRREKITAALHIQAQQEEAARIYALLAQHDIPYIPLKGQVIRGYYPQSWMRNSRDVDILIPRSHHEAVCRILQEEHGYSVMAKGGHDVMFRAANGLCMEMHYRLLEVDNARLESVWDRAQPTGVGTEYRLCDADFYLYHLAHMAKHFRNGGCGIRPVMDLWLFMKRDYRDESLTQLLAQYDLLAFTQMMEQLSRVWFGGEDHSESTRRIEGYLLRGGVHGDEHFYHAETLLESRGKFRYLLSRVFPPFDKLKAQYPRLAHQPWLAPFYAIHRLLRIIFGREKSVYRTQMQQIQGISKEKQQEIQAIWKDVGF